jgi:hypothetical protein
MTNRSKHRRIVALKSTIKTQTIPKGAIRPSSMQLIKFQEVIADNIFARYMPSWPFSSEHPSAAEENT